MFDSMKGIACTAPTCSTPGMAASLADARSTKLRSAAGPGLRSHANICMTITWSRLKPVSTFSRLTKLRSSRPVPDTSINAIATSAMTSAERRCRCDRSAVMVRVSGRLQAETGEAQRRDQSRDQRHRARQEHRQPQSPSHRPAAHRSTSLRAVPSSPGRAWRRGRGRGPQPTRATPASGSRPAAGPPDGCGWRRARCGPPVPVGGRSAAGEQQVGDVDARDQQHGDHRAAKQRDGRPHVADQVLAQGDHLGAHVLVGARILVSPCRSRRRPFPPAPARSTRRP